MDGVEKEHLAPLKARKLDETRQAKKPITAAEHYPPTPTVFRQPVLYRQTGLTNINNTCYMNTTLQCLRYIPKLSRFYRLGEYEEHIHGTPDITNEVVRIIRALWSGSYSIIQPIDFYNKFTSLAPMYSLGLHEDCMEFFLQLFTFLSEDVASVIPAQNQTNWHKQHGGKESFYINHFYHELRSKQLCKHCHTITFKYEIGNIFYLPVPNKEFRLTDCMASYLSSVEKSTCKRCYKRNTVRKSISNYPRILVITLKRQIQEFADGTVYFRKNKNQCHFPVNNFMVDDCVYELNAIALHTGTSQYGHYMAACLNRVSHQWYLYNDEKVRHIKNIYNPMIRSQAYAFFYSLKSEAPSNFH